MKKLIAFVLVFVCVFSLVGCNNKTVYLDLPFEISNIENIEIYRFDGTPDYVEKKIAITEEDIRTVYDMFERLSFTTKKAKETAGTTTSFRFNLTDGTSYEMVYTCFGVKRGSLKSTTGNFEYFATSDIGAVWGNVTAKAAQAKSGELPK